MTIIIDTNVVLTAKLPALKALANGDLIGGRYLDRLDVNNPKVIKPAEARAFAAAGVPLFLIYEIGGKPSGAPQGQLDREWCESYLPTIGMPSDSAIYSAIDYDAPAADMPGIVAYHKAFQSQRYRSGGYGSGYTLSQLTANGVITLRWIAESTGFSGTKEATLAGQYDLLQMISPPIDGVDVDVSRVRVPGFDFGARVPFAVAPPIAPIAAAPMTPAEHEGFLAKLREIITG